MTGCRARAALFGVLAFLLAAAATPAAFGYSQPTPPRPLTPPAAGGWGAPPAAPAIVVEPLKAPDAAGIGVLDPREGGFGPDMWSGTPRSLVLKLLPELPARTTSPAMRGMMRRLLLSAAVPPGETPPPPGDVLLRLRVERLYAMGDVDGMLALIDVIPATALSAAVLRHRVDGLLLNGDHKAACQQLPAARKGDAGDGYLAKVSAFCDALAGRAAQASLTAAWLRERGHADAAFQVLLERLGGVAAEPLSSLPEPTPLHLAMLAAARQPLPDDVADGDQPAILRTVALSTNAPAEARLVAAEKAERVGALDTENLRRLYSAVTFTSDEALRPLDDAASADGWRSRALLFRVAQMQPAAQARAELIGKALALARRQDHFVASARLYAPLIAAMAPAPELTGFAGDAVRALMAAGRGDAVAPWLALCDTGAGPPRGGPVWPLLRLMQPHEDEPPPAGQLRAWLNQRAALPPERAQRQAELLFGLLDALGERVRTEDWLELMQGPTSAPTVVPRPALWHAQRVAAEDLRMAETVLLALVSLGEKGPATADPTVLYRIVASLRLVGFDEEARALALEAVLANGV